MVSQKVYFAASVSICACGLEKRWAPSRYSAKMLELSAAADQIPMVSGHFLTLNVLSAFSLRHGGLKCSHKTFCYFI